MTIQEKLEPLTRMTTADVQQWCRDNPFVKLGGTEHRSDSCLISAIASAMAGTHIACGMGFLFVGSRSNFHVTLSIDAGEAVERYDNRVCFAGHVNSKTPITAIEAAALMWPEVFADEAKLLVESVQEAAAQC